ncbi:MAG TPA: PAS domain S-box protein [Actinomycetota bacterium]|nr:PAS domain S-box protein [Actinomycetota bacterium]
MSITGEGLLKRWTLPTVAVMLFAAIIALRFAVPDKDQAVLVLCVVPIALIAIRLGTAWGLAAATFSQAAFVAWSMSQRIPVGVFDHLSRATAFFLVGGLVGHFVTQRSKVEEQHARWFDLSVDLACTAGFDGYFKRVNPAWGKTLGYTDEELTSRPFLDLVHPEDRARTENQAAKLAGATETIDFQNRYRAKDGSYHWIEWAARGVPSEQLIYASARDVTDRKRAEAAQQEAEERFRTASERALNESQTLLDEVADNASAMISIKDLDGRYMLINRHFKRVFQVTDEQLIGKTDHDWLSQEAANANRVTDQFVIHKHNPLEIDETVVHPDGELHSYISQKFPLFDSSGEPYAVCGISTDVTAHKREEEAKRSNLAKNDFLSRMSHELRTPLNAILGFAQLSQMDVALDSDHRENIDHIVKGGRHLLLLINEVLDIARIEAGGLSLSIEPVHALTVISESVDLVRPLAAESEVALNWTLPEGYSRRHVLADHQRVKQILLNLLSNAVKYSRKGDSVTVVCEDVEGGHMRIVVMDTGPGIRSEELERLFVPFDRLRAEGSEIEGTGLGLALSKGLADAMGANIGVTSEVGRGSRFWLYIQVAEDPVDRLPRLDQHAEKRATMTPGTVLYIEDNLSNLKLIERIFATRPQLSLMTAIQGQVGLDLARRHLPDVILLDLNLPDMPGEEVLADLKRDPLTDAIPVFIVTADATKTHVNRLLNAGASAFITKPIDVKELLATIDQAVASGVPE